MFRTAADSYSFQWREVVAYLVTTPIGWSHSVNVSKAKQIKVLFSEWSTDGKSEVKELISDADLKYHFSRYNDNFFVTGKNKCEVMSTYYCV